MKLSMYCATFITKFRVSNHRWKGTIPLFQKTSLLERFVHRGTAQSFHSTASLKAKSFQERENEFAHSVMQKIPSYGDCIVRTPLSESAHRSSTQVVKDFVQVTLVARDQDLSMEDEKFSNLIARLSGSLAGLDDPDLMSVLHYLCLWPPSPKSYSRNFKLLWNSLDSELTRRLQRWEVDVKLLVADYWFCLRLSRISQYNRAMIRSLLDDTDSLSHRQVVQLMFYVNLQRKASVEALKKRLKALVDCVSLEEIGIVCIGFFKTEGRIEDFDVVETIVRRLRSEMPDAHTLTVAAVLKFLRKSMQLSETETYVRLLHSCVRWVHTWDVPTSIHAALLSSECHVYHPLLLDTVSRRVESSIQTARLKDCTKLLQCLAHFNHFSEPRFHEAFRRELGKPSRRAEIEAYPLHLAYTCLFYAYLGCYDNELLRTALEPEFVRGCLQKYPHSTNSFSELDYCIEVECPSYMGPRLAPEERKLPPSRRGNLPGTSHPNLQTRIVLEVVEALHGLCIDRRDVAVRHLLPHFFSPDVVVRLSGSKEPLSCVVSRVSPDAVVAPPADEVWACFVTSTSFSFAYRSKQLTGVTAMKLRQLEAVGYKTVFIPFYELPLNEGLRKKYVGGKLRELEAICNVRIPYVL